MKQEIECGLCQHSGFKFTSKSPIQYIHIYWYQKSKKKITLNRKMSRHRILVEWGIQNGGCFQSLLNVSLSGLVSPQRSLIFCGKIHQKKKKTESWQFKKYLFTYTHFFSSKYKEMEVFLEKMRGKKILIITARTIDNRMDSTFYYNLDREDCPL